MFNSFSRELNLLPVLITNYHVIKDSLFEKKINLMINDENIEIELESNRKVYLSEKYNITILEITKNDGLDINSFLELDEQIFKENSSNDIYEQYSIFFLQNSEYSKGKISRLHKDNFTFEYSGITKPYSIGSPIININNYKVIAIHKENKEEYNIGVFIKKPILNFIKKKEIIGNLEKEKFKDEITIIYNRDISIPDRFKISTGNHFFNGEKSSIYKLFGEEFVENNKNKCKIIINEKEYKLCSYLNEENEIKDDIFDIKLKGINNIKNASNLFDGCQSLVSLPDISKWDTSNVNDMRCLFSRCCSLTYLSDISNWNTSNVKKMNAMFFNCQSLSLLPDISKWNISNVISLTEIFSRCLSLKKLPDISKWNTSNVLYMNYIFSDCIKLENLPDISKWNTSSVKDISYMFQYCKSLTSLPDISRWITDNVTNMSFLFINCESLKSLPDISKWNTSNVTNMKSLFRNCFELTMLPDISKWKTFRVVDMSYMFSYCSKLKTLPDISKWNISNVTTMTQMFYHCDVNLNIPSKFNNINTLCSFL